MIATEAEKMDDDLYYGLETDCHYRQPHLTSLPGATFYIRTSRKFSDLHGLSRTADKA